ncbi:MAG: PQQ-binding-like beta-propeller repeat protein [Methanoregula sp.]|jgi:WD40 repeat protein|nr:PQQ-binding-like beta-propeller repeat protein [Methanoregula sp.]
MPSRIRFGLILTFILIFPVFASALTSNSALPIWSDQIGEYRVLVDCSDDGRYVVAGSDSGMLRMYTDSGKILWTDRVPEKSIMAVAMSGNGESVAAAFFDPLAASQDAGGEILYYNRSGEPLWSYYTGSTVHRIAVDTNGETILASGDSTLYLFDKTGNVRKNLKLNGTAWGIAMSGDGSLGVAGTERLRGEIFVTDTNGTARWSYPTLSGMRAVDISGNGESIAGVDRYHLYWFNKNQTPSWQYNSSPAFRAVAVSSNGEYGAAGSQYYLRFFNRTGSLLWKYEDNGDVGGVALSANGSEIIAGMSGGTILFDRSGAILWKYGNGSMYVAASKDGNYFVSGSSTEINFFNRFGTTKIIKMPVTDTIIDPTAEATSLRPTAKPAPLLGILPVIAICCGAICAFAQRRL